MSLTTTTGIALILSTLIYHGGLAFLFARAQFGDILSLPRGEKLVIIAEYTGEYRWGCRIILAGWIVAALGYVMLAALLRDAGDPIISTLAAVLFLIGICRGGRVLGVSCIAYGVGRGRNGPHLEDAGVLRRSFKCRQNPHWGVYQLLGLLATAGFGWALLQTGLLPSWVGWVTLGWGVVWAGVFLKTSSGFPLLPMVMQVVIGTALLLR